MIWPNKYSISPPKSEVLFVRSSSLCDIGRKNGGALLLCPETDVVLVHKLSAMINLVSSFSRQFSI